MSNGFCDWCIAVYVAWLIMTGFYMLATSRIRKRVKALETRMQTMESLVRGEVRPDGPYRANGRAGVVGAVLGMLAEKDVPKEVLRAAEEIARRG